MTRVLVLGGGPDPDREQSIASATAVRDACEQAGLDAMLRLIDRPGLEEINAWDTDVVFPVLHGRWGAGGELQSLLEKSGKHFVGCRPQAARLGIDRLGAKLIAARFGITSPAAVMLDRHDVRDPKRAYCPLQMPVVLRPAGEGPGIEHHTCYDDQQWRSALEAVAGDWASAPNRAWVIERLVMGRELTASLICNESGELEALPLVETFRQRRSQATGERRGRDHLVVDPEFDYDIAKRIQEHALLLGIALGVRHLAQIDFLYSDDGPWVMLDVITMPVLTPGSHLPLAAQARGMGMPRLCEHLVSTALNERDATAAFI